MKNTIIKAAFLAGMLVCTFVQAGVNPRNGNFFISYTLSTEAQTATYNSKATERGWYGYGWGSLFETRLLVMHDGTAVVLENGTGRQTFYGKRGAALAQQQLIRQILDDVVAVDKLDPWRVEDIRRKLADQDERVRYLKTYGMSGEMAIGMALKGESCDEAQLRKLADRYERRECNGDIDEFDQRGWLLKRTSADGKVRLAEYGNSPYPMALVEADGTRIELAWNNRGQVLSQARTDAKGKPVRALMTYDAAGNLILLAYEGGPSDGSSTRFKYDAKHNLTEIRYIDDSTMQITYDKAGDLATAVSERTGQKYRYEYSTDAVTGEDATVIYSSSDGGPEQVRRLRYAKDGLPTRTEDAPGRWTEYAYHPTLRKVVLMRNPSTERRFEYDDKGQVTFATDTQSGRSARFTYDNKGQVIRLLSVEGDTSRKDLRFRYNANGKPVEIRLDGVGHIDVRYSASGEIEAVNSPDGARTALAVTQAFQSMLSIVKMSGASLGY